MIRWTVAKRIATAEGLRGEPWATIEIDPLYTRLHVREEIADTVVALVNDMHNHLAAAIEKLIVGDSTWRDHVSKTRLDTDELQRLGRPRTSKRDMVRYADRYGTDAAARRFHIAPGTLDRYRKEVQKEYGQK